MFLVKKKQKKNENSNLFHVKLYLKNCNKNMKFMKIVSIKIDFITEFLLKKKNI